MSESRATKRTTISAASIPEEIGEYWDSHSLDESWDEGHDVAFELRAQRRRRVMLSPEVYARLSKEAQLRGIATETLVNLWLAERLQNAAELPDVPNPPMQPPGSARG
jgi:hypothetical protein